MGWVSSNTLNTAMSVHAFAPPCEDEALLDYAMRQPHAAIFDGEAWNAGRLTLLFAPRLHYRFTGDQWIGREGERNFSSPADRPFTETLNAVLGAACTLQGETSTGVGVSPLASTGVGWVCFASYDLAPHFEPSVGAMQAATSGFPLFIANRYTFALIREQSGKWYLHYSDPGGTESAEGLLERLTHDLMRHRLPTETCRLAPLRAEWSRAEYDAAFARVQEHISAGDIYQANLTQRFFAACTPAACAGASWNAASRDGPSAKVDAPTLYRGLSKVASEAYSCYFDCGEGRAILSSSPECFLRVSEGVISTRPIKGTRPVSPDAEANAQLASELAASEKDRAELTMIVDLERNDLGRICKIGSVTVPELFVVERYRHVHHLLATVRGELAPGVGFSDMLAATFPGGSITGAPKIRALQLLRDIEPSSRGPYTGSIFALAPDGSMESNILIRTLLVTPEGVRFSVGGGIVADSQCDAEYEECRTKAHGMALALSERCNVSVVCAL